MMSRNSTFGLIPFSTNSTRPTGGVTSPISTSRTSMTPNQIGSRPIATMIGNVTDSVISIMAINSMKQPRIR